MRPSRARAWLNLMQSHDTARWFKGKHIEPLRWPESWP